MLDLEDIQFFLLLQRKPERLGLSQVLIYLKLSFK